MTHAADLALERFTSGLSCSQAVFSALSEDLGVPRDTALRLASAFGGGMARRGEVCGAVTGALMALGLARGHVTADEEGKEQTYRLANEFADRFAQRHGSLRCQALIGCLLSTHEGLQEARDRGVFKDICPGLVRDAAEIAEAIIGEIPDPVDAGDAAR